jgi:hypothetical protein
MMFPKHILKVMDRFRTNTVVPHSYLLRKAIVGSLVALMQH